MPNIPGRILIISYYLPPVLTGGTQRPVKIAKFLKRQGKEVYLLGPSRYPDWLPSDARQSIPCDKIEVVPIFLPPKDTNLYQTGDRILLRRIFNYIMFPDIYLSWSLAVILRLGRILDTIRPDVVLTTSPPISVHLIGLMAKSHCHVKWIADFRDSWLGDPDIVWRPQTILRYPFMSVVEKIIMRKADIISTTRESITQDLLSRTRRDQIVTITNGYDLDDWRDVIPKSYGGFTIVHTGSLSWGTRNLESLYQALRMLEFENPGKYKLLLVGPDASKHAQKARQIGLSNVIDCGLVSRQESLALQAGADALLLVGSATTAKNGRQVLPGKLFEYLAARRPIIAAVPKGSDAYQILQAWPLTKAVDLNDPSQIASSIRDIAEHPLPVVLHPPQEYNWETLVDKFVAMLP